MNRMVRRNMYRNLSALERDYGFNGGRAWRPALDIIETDDAYVVQAALPGLSADDIDVDIDDGVLTIKADRSDENEEQADKYLLRERSYGKFARSVRLPKNVSADEISATVESGILTLTLPKSEDAKPKSIEVKTA